MADESSFERPQAIYEDVDMSRSREN